jgi:4-amino-4-deoxy-L-arabinose transferase-like glycosyltransferase
MKVRNKLMMVLGSALLMKVVLIIIFKTHQNPVFQEYESIANNILAGKGFVYNFLNNPYASFCNPLYAWLCAAVYALTGHSYAAMLLIQSVVSVLLALVVFDVAKTTFDEKIGLYSAFLVSFHPGFVYYDVFNLVPLSIDSLFIASVTLLFMRYKDRPTALNMSIVGGLIGAGVLSRGIIGALMPFLSLYMLVFMRKIAVKERLKAVFFIVLATFLVIAPWIVRNYVIHKEILIISTTGETFWRGNNEYAVGTSFNKNGKTMMQLWPEDFKKKVYSLDEMGQKKFFEKEAMNFIRNNPLRFIKLYIKKVYYYWWFSPQSGIVYPGIYLHIYKYIYIFLIAFSVLGAAMAILFGEEVTRDNAFLLVFIFASICFTQSFFYVEGRHRWLIEPLLIIFFSYGASEAYKFLLKKGRLLFADLHC